MIFAASEYQARLTRAQALMAQHELAGILLTTPPEFAYFAGFQTRFWESPSRPWYLILPSSGEPIAVIPGIGAHLMGQTWVRDIRTWAAPNPADEGISLLVDALCDLKGPIGIPSGPETILRLSLNDYAKLQSLPLRDDGGITAQLRAIKSEAEIAKIKSTCAVANRAFDRVPEIAQPGTPLAQVFRDFQRLLLEEGADYVSYLAGAAGQGGYVDVISPADDTPLALGDIVMLDTGAVKDSYFCDFDRNFSVQAPAPEIQTAHGQLLEATQAGFEAARPGITAAELYHTMAAITGADENAGRFGHGLGLQLTEGLSLMPADATVLEPGMVITLEPGILTKNGKLLVHEENIVIREGAAEPLSRLATDLMMIG